MGKGSISVILGGEHWGSGGCEPAFHECFQGANRPSRTIFAPSLNTQWKLQNLFSHIACDQLSLAHIPHSPQRPHLSLDHSDMSILYRLCQLYRLFNSLWVMGGVPPGFIRTMFPHPLRVPRFLQTLAFQSCLAWFTVLQGGGETAEK